MGTYGWVKIKLNKWQNAILYTLAQNIRINLTQISSTDRLTCNSNDEQVGGGS